MKLSMDLEDKLQIYLDLKHISPANRNNLELNRLFKEILSMKNAEVTRRAWQDVPSRQFALAIRYLQSVQAQGLGDRETESVLKEWLRANGYFWNDSQIAEQLPKLREELSLLTGNRAELR